MAKTILIVDDNPHIRKSMCVLLKGESDLEVCDQAENGKDAIDQALKLLPDLIVLDLSMPVMNGLEAARELKRLMPHVTLIMYSAYGVRAFRNHLKALVDCCFCGCNALRQISTVKF